MLEDGTLVSAGYVSKHDLESCVSGVWIGCGFLVVFISIKICHGDDFHFIIFDWDYIRVTLCIR